MPDDLVIEGKAAIATCCNVVAELVSTDVDSAEDEERLEVRGELTDLVSYTVQKITHVVRCPNFHCRRDHRVYQTIESRGEVLQQNVYGFEA